MKANLAFLLVLLTGVPAVLPAAHRTPIRTLPAALASAETAAVGAGALMPEPIKLASMPVGNRTSAEAPPDEILMEITSLETNLTALYDDLAVLPDPDYGGLILMWSGPTNSIPSGWALCDGANGTPDLRDRFIRGADGVGEVGELGGATNHAHTAAGHEHRVITPGHSHSVSEAENIPTDPAGLHTHTVGPSSGPNRFVKQDGFGGESVAADDHFHVA